jgi:hypothetical protein
MPCSDAEGATWFCNGVPLCPVRSEEVGFVRWEGKEENGNQLVLYMIPAMLLIPMVDDGAENAVI